MAKLRSWKAYRRLERPYTRFSKVRNKAFVKSKPGKKVIKYHMGDLVNGSDQFPIKVQMTSRDSVQIRANSLEAARTAISKKLDKQFGRTGYFFKIFPVPHHAIRENPLAAGAGADRLSTGMKHSFGKIIGTAAQVHKGDKLMELYVPDGYGEFARDLLRQSAKKLTARVSFTLEERKAKKLTKEQVEAKMAEEQAYKERKERKEAEAEEAGESESSEATEE